jgi:histidine triad (HIT) family protein
MQFLYALARTKPGGWLAWWIIAKMSILIPSKRLYETASLVAFNHQQPSYPVHILLVPKKHIVSLADLSMNDSGLIEDLLSAVHALTLELDLDKIGYRLIVNGGAYQEFARLHFHLVSGNAIPQNQS